MELKTVRWEASDGVGVLTLDRPERANSWTGRMHAEIRHVFAGAEADPGVRVVVVTGAGKTFCPGADRRALEGHVERGGYDAGTPDGLARPGHGARPELDADFAWLLGSRLVTIAAVNGAAAGVGLALACYCDLRIAAEGAKLTVAHGRLNLPAEYGLSWLLPRLVGVTRAADLLLSSRVFLAEEAEEMGLLNRVVPAGEVLPTALGYARALVADTTPASLAVTKRQLWVDQLHDDVGRSVRTADRLMRHMVTQPDYAEAVRAFVEKRPGRWAGSGIDDVLDPAHWT